MHTRTFLPAIESGRSGMLPGRVDHSYLVHSATCQIQTTIWRGNHVAYHTAAGWDLHSAEALRFEIEPDQGIGLQPDSLYQTLPSSVIAIPYGSDSAPPGDAH